MTSPLLHLQNDDRRRQPWNVKLFVQENHCQMMKEALNMETHSDLDVWLKESRIRALKNLSKDFDESAGFPSYNHHSSIISQDMMLEQSATTKQTCLSRNPGHESAKLPSYKVSTQDMMPKPSTATKPTCLSRNPGHEFSKLPSYEVSTQDMMPKPSTATKLTCLSRNPGHEFAKLPSYEVSTQDMQKPSTARKQPRLSRNSGHESAKLRSYKVSTQDMMPKPSTATKPTCLSRNPTHELANLPSYKVATPLTSESALGFFDSHCHLDMLFEHEKFKGTYADYIAQHKDSYPNSYKGCVAVFCKPWTFSKTYMWRRHLEQNNVWGAFGCHPKNAKDYCERIEHDLKVALDHPKVKALGEIGLDYSERNTSSEAKQHEVFRRQLKIARDRKLPVVIHCRDAEEDTIRIMLEILPRSYKFHLHCFTGTWKSAQRWIAEFPNVFIGLTNLVTFPSAKPTHEVAKKLPLERLLLETDAPYFVPRVFSKDKSPKCSHPGMAIHVANKVAALKNVPVEEVLHYTQSNTKRVYNLP